MLYFHKVAMVRTCTCPHSSNTSPQAWRSRIISSNLSPQWRHITWTFKITCK